MDIDLFLEILRVQRHDFLNYLQVISGFLQLNKTEEAQEYIQEAVLEIGSLGKIMHFKPPEAAAAFLIARNEADKYQIDVDYDMESDLELCALPGSETGWCLRKGLLQALICMSSPEISNRRLKVCLREMAGSYFCRIYFSFHEQVTSVEETLALINEHLAAYKVRAWLSISEDQGEIIFSFPKK